MKKQASVILCVSVILLLTGCASVEERIKDKLEDKLSMNENYRLYSEYSDQLDENGYYNGCFSVLNGTSEEELSLDRLGLNGTEEALGEPDPHDGLVHVTFAENSMFNVEYYRDPDHDNELTGGECWLAPGESVYAAEPLKTKNVTSNKFGFWKFRIFNIDSDGDFQQSSSDGKGALLTIPENYSGMGYSVEPIGKYERRRLTFSAFNTEDDSVVSDVSWYVNDEPYSDEKGLSPTAAYSVRCNFNITTKDYYVESTEPSVDSASITNDSVKFSKEQPENGADSYTVKLHRYLSGRLTGDLNGVKDNNGNITLKYKSRGDSEWIKISPDNNNSIHDLKVGDQLLVRVKKGFKMQCVPFEGTEPKSVDGMYEYTITVGEVSDTHEFLINLCGDRAKDTVQHKSASVEHGTLSVRLRDGGHVIKDGDYIAPQMTVIITKTADDGYKIEEPNCLLAFVMPHVRDGVYTWETTYSEYLDKLQSDVIDGHPIVAK